MLAVIKFYDGTSSFKNLFGFCIEMRNLVIFISMVAGDSSGKFVSSSLSFEISRDRNSTAVVSGCSSVTPGVGAGFTALLDSKLC